MLLSQFIKELEELQFRYGDQLVGLQGDKKSWNFEVGGYYFELEEKVIIGLVQVKE